MVIPLLIGDLGAVFAWPETSNKSWNDLEGKFNVWLWQEAQMALSLVL